MILPPIGLHTPAPDGAPDAGIAPGGEVAFDAALAEALAAVFNVTGKIAVEAEPEASELAPEAEPSGPDPEHGEYGRDASETSPPAEMGVAVPPAGDLPVSDEVEQVLPVTGQTTLEASSPSEEAGVDSPPLAGPSASTGAPEGSRSPEPVAAGMRTPGPEGPETSAAPAGPNVGAEEGYSLMGYSFMGDASFTGDAGSIGDAEPGVAFTAEAEPGVATDGAGRRAVTDGQPGADDAPPQSGLRAPAAPDLKPTAPGPTGQLQPPPHPATGIPGTSASGPVDALAPANAHSSPSPMNTPNPAEFVAAPTPVHSDVPPAADAAVPAPAPAATETGRSEGSPGPVLSEPARRVMEAVDAARRAAPPNRVVVDLPELEGLRLQISVKGEVVAMTVLGGGSRADVDAMFSETARALEARGFELGEFSEKREHRDQSLEEGSGFTTTSSTRRRARDEAALRL